MLQEAFSHPSGFTVFMAPMAFTAFHGFTVFTPKHTSTGEGKFSRAQTVFFAPKSPFDLRLCFSSPKGPPGRLGVVICPTLKRIETINELSRAFRPCNRAFRFQNLEAAENLDVFGPKTWRFPENLGVFGPETWRFPKSWTFSSPKPVWKPGRFRARNLDVSEKLDVFEPKPGSFRKTSTFSGPGGRPPGPREGARP